MFSEPENAVVCVHCVLFLYDLMNSRLDFVFVSKNLNFVTLSHSPRISAECNNLVQVKNKTRKWQDLYLVLTVRKNLGVQAFGAFVECFVFILTLSSDRSYSLIS